MCLWGPESFFMPQICYRDLRQMYLILKNNILIGYGQLICNCMHITQTDLESTYCWTMGISNWMLELRELVPLPMGFNHWSCVISRINKIATNQRNLMFELAFDPMYCCLLSIDTVLPVITSCPWTDRFDIYNTIYPWARFVTSPVVSAHCEQTPDWFFCLLGRIRWHCKIILYNM